MSTLTVLRSVHALPLSVYRQNVASRAVLEARMTAFVRTFGRTPVMVSHPEGACCIGVRPTDEELADPPEGWLADPARNVLVPTRSTTSGAIMWQLMDELSWNWERLPGLHPATQPSLLRYRPLQPEEITRDEPLSRTGVIEVNGALWAVIEPERVPGALASGLWEKCRRSQLVAEVHEHSPQAGWIETPDMAVGV